MEAGKHVVTDKPMCLSLREADAMIAVENAIACSAFFKIVAGTVTS